MKSFKTVILELDLHRRNGDVNRIFDVAEPIDDGLDHDLEKLVASFVGGSKEEMREMGYGIFRPKNLESAYTNNTEIFQKLQKAFQPVKDALKKEFGHSILLFRSERNRKLGDTRELLSYTSDASFAEMHASGYRVKSLDAPTEEDAAKKIAEFRSKGTIKINWPGCGTKTIVRDDDERYGVDDPDACCVMDGEDIVICDDITDSVMGYLQTSKMWCARVIKHLSKIVVEEVPIDDIVWVTNRAYQHEFIVKNKPRERKPYVEDQKSAI